MDYIVSGVLGVEEEVGRMIAVIYSLRSFVHEIERHGRIRCCYCNREVAVDGKSFALFLVFQIVTWASSQILLVPSFISFQCLTD